MATNPVGKIKQGDEVWFYSRRKKEAERRIWARVVVIRDDRAWVKIHIASGRDAESDSVVKLANLNRMTDAEVIA